MDVEGLGVGSSCQWMVVEGLVEMLPLHTGSWVTLALRKS
jgi:hypothetical protein